MGSDTGYTLSNYARQAGHCAYQSIEVCPLCYMAAFGMGMRTAAILLFRKQELNGGYKRLTETNSLIPGKYFETKE
jgi:hypothetical protein